HICRTDARRRSEVHRRDQGNRVRETGPLRQWLSYQEAQRGHPLDHGSVHGRRYLCWKYIPRVGRVCFREMRQVVLRRKNEPPDTWAAFLLRRVEVIASELLLSGVYSQKPV